MKKKKKSLIGRSLYPNWTKHFKFSQDNIIILPLITKVKEPCSKKLKVTVEEL